MQTGKQCLFVVIEKDSFNALYLFECKDTHGKDELQGVIVLEPLLPR